MARLRKLVLAVASGTALYSGVASALGLGEITLHSALSQPLDAEIELLQVGDLATSDMHVRLAPADVFARSGVERVYFLNDLRFTPILRGSRSVIRVVSSKPVREPYLNFIVEVARPGGQLYREYTVLLDPPGSTAYSSSAAPIAATAATRTPQATASANKAPVPTRMPQAALGQRYRVQGGDSLWSISGKLVASGSSASRESLMEDIFALNQAAFVGGDRHRLRVDQQLLLPDSAAPAMAEVAPLPASQLSAPAAEVAGAQVSAPTSSPNEAAAAQPSLDALASETPAPAPLSEEVAQVNAQLQTVTDQNAQLQSALSQMQSQLDQLRQQMEEKDRQLQVISQEMAQRPAAEASTPPSESASSSSFGWSSWLMAGLPVLGLALFGLLVAYRRRAKEQAPEPTNDAPRLVHVGESPMVSRPVVVEPVAEPDPLEGANVYIAYGRFAEAASALRRSIELYPQRADLRLRLSEVYGELGDESAFLDQEKALLDLGVPPARIEPIKARYFAGSRTQAAQPAAVAEPEAVEPLVDSDFQLNLDDLSLDADWDLVSPFKADTPARLKKAEEEVVHDPHFASNLRELPEVFEMDMEHGESRVEPVDEYVLDEQFLDAFADESEQPLQPIDLDHLAGNPEHMTKLNQALAYIKQGDIAAACDILNEVIDEGDEQEKEAARLLLAEIA